MLILPASGLNLNITYGITIRAHDDEIARSGDQATAETGSVSVGAMLVDFFPIRKFLDIFVSERHLTLVVKVKHWPLWMPFSGFKRHALYTRGLVQSLLETPYQHVKTQMVRVLNTTATNVC